MRVCRKCTYRQSIHPFMCVYTSILVLYAFMFPPTQIAVCICMCISKSSDSIREIILFAPRSPSAKKARRSQTSAGLSRWGRSKQGRSNAFEMDFSKGERFFGKGASRTVLLSSNTFNLQFG